MKSRLISILTGLFIIVFLAACVGAPFTKAGEATYPSQFLTGDVYILENDERIDGNIFGIGTTLIIEEGATVMGDISLIASNLEVNGQVNGDINLFAGTSKINETAVVTGSINQIFNQTYTSPEALISGEINTYVFPSSGESNLGKGLLDVMDWLKPTYWLALQIGRIILLVLMAVLSIFLFKLSTLRIVRAIKKSPIVSWGAGLLTQFFLPLIALVLIVTICLSPIGIISILALLISIIWGWAAISIIVGERLASWLKFDWSDEVHAVIGALIAGLFVSLITLIPCLGFLVNLLISAIGLGGVLLSRFGTLES